MNELWELAKVFSYVSLLTIGGGMAAFPELKTLVVAVHHWLDESELIHLYSVGQMAPGPNMMVVVTIGLLVAGLGGAAVAFAAFFGPTALLTLGAGRLWSRLEHWKWRSSIQRGLAPVSVGLLIAGCITVAQTAIKGWLHIAMSAIVFALLLRTKINPALLILAGAVIGAFMPSRL